MNVTPEQFSAFAVSEIFSQDGAQVAYMHASGEIKQGAMSKTTHCIPGEVANWISPSDSHCFFNLSLSEATFGRVPCEIRVHENMNNLNLFTSTNPCGGSVIARGFDQPWCKRLKTLVHITKTITSGFIHIDFPQAMEYAESLDALRLMMDEIKTSMQGKHIVVLVPRLQHSSYTSFDTGGTIVYDESKRMDLEALIRGFATTYDTTLAEAFTHVAGYCMVSTVKTQHFIMQLPECVMPMRFTDGSSKHSICARSSGSIVKSSMTFGSTNGGFLFHAGTGKWSISFLATLTQPLPDNIACQMTSMYTERTRFCIELMQARTPASAGAAFFQLVSVPEVADDIFEQLVTVVIQSIEEQFGVHIYRKNPRFYREPQPAVCRQASMGVDFSSL